MLGRIEREAEFELPGWELQVGTMKGGGRERGRRRGRGGGGRQDRKQEVSVSYDGLVACAGGKCFLRTPEQKYFKQQEFGERSWGSSQSSFRGLD